jgi:hypothetical protein
LVAAKTASLQATLKTAAIASLHPGDRESKDGN